MPLNPKLCSWSRNLAEEEGLIIKIRSTKNETKTQSGLEHLNFVFWICFGFRVPALLRVRHLGQPDSENGAFVLLRLYVYGPYVFLYDFLHDEEA